MANRMIITATTLTFYYYSALTNEILSIFNCAQV
jgi:hypothetical protein